MRQLPFALLLIMSAVAVSTMRLPILAAASASTGPVTAASVPADDLQWLVVEPIEGKANGWLRFVFDTDPGAADRALLTLATDSRCSLYVNGQRLLKYKLLPRADGNVTAAGFDVHSLLRRGRNSITIDMHSEAGRSVAGIRLTLNSSDKATNVNGAWKSAPAVPPVGWTQTDFNDRDWAAVTILAAQPEATFAVLPPTEMAAAAVAPRQRQTPFQLEDGDHVVLLGATFFERAQQYGHMEAALAAAAGDKHVTFRNLGWSADTVFAESRGIFDSPEQGYLRMIEHVRAEEPTVIIVCYGQNEALQMSISEQQFAEQYTRLLTDLQTTGATIVVMSPHELFPGVRPVPDSSRFNRVISVYRDVAAQVAGTQSHQFVDLFSDFTADMQHIDSRMMPSKLGLSQQDARRLSAVGASQWTDNGIHLNDRGYATASPIIRDRLLSMTAARPALMINSAEAVVRANGIDVRNVQWNPDNKTMLRLQLKRDVLSALPLALQLSVAEMEARGLTCEIVEADEAAELLPRQQPGDSGRVTTTNGSTILEFDASHDSQYETLRDLIVRKNELYFHRWRPQNITYLFGFRKHEQGNNAVEIAQFDPLIEALEAQVHAAQLPRWKTLIVRRQTSDDP